MEEVSGWGPIVTAGILRPPCRLHSQVLLEHLKHSKQSARITFSRTSLFSVWVMDPATSLAGANILAFFVAAASIAIGDLIVIAPIISDFFLIVYALINYAVFAVSRARSPRMASLV